MNIESASAVSSGKSSVVILRCKNYDLNQVQECLSKGLELLGGIKQFVQSGERILLKPNLLSGKPPKKAVTTHPVVFESVARLFSEAGALLSYGDSPGFGRSTSVAARAGLAEIAEKLDIKLAEFENGQTVSFPKGTLCKQFTIATGVLEAQGIISLPKLKTHALTRMTGAIKNQFGCIPGMLKGEFHGRLHKVDRFSEMLVDLTRYLAPRLYIMDGITAMEGNGPGNGTPNNMGVLLMSTDPVALDAVVCHLIDLDPDLVPTIRAGVNAGLGKYDEMEVLGDAFEECACPDFKVNRRREISPDSVNRFLVPLMRHYLIPRPVIRADRCTRCGSCVKMCPVTPKAIDFRQESHSLPPQYDYGKCIRCYCCQEICPDNAIEIETPWLGRLIRRYNF